MEQISLPTLRVERDEAYQKIQVQIEKGTMLHDRNVSSKDELEDAMNDFNNWSNYNEKLLLKLFGNASLVKEYNKEIGVYELFDVTTTLEDEINSYRSYVTTKNKRLEGICDQLELFAAPSDTPKRTSANNEISDMPGNSGGSEVFIVHGHDEAAKFAVARFVDKFDIAPIILDEHPDKGQTIIDKFETHATEAAFAIVLLTPDDVGAPNYKENELHPRARQNTILELGYFFGKLGRERVCVLYKEEVELPSDIHGILYVPMNSPHEWELKLAQEMDQAGLPVDFNKLKKRN